MAYIYEEKKKYHNKELGSKLLRLLAILLGLWL